jgi:hypothetical protein
MTTMVTVQPVGWIGERGTRIPSRNGSSRSQGRWFVESMDGTAWKWGRENSRSAGIRIAASPAASWAIVPGTVGDTPAVLMVVQLNDAPAPPRHAHSGEP